jgi:hypothetical protein
MVSTNVVILSSVTLTAATTLLKELEQGKMEFRPFLSASVMGIMLTGMAMVNDRLARNFAILIVMVVLLKDGGHVFTFAQSATSRKGKQHG